MDTAAGTGTPRGARGSMRMRLAVAGLLALHAVLLFDGARRDAVTFDELHFLAAGHVIWQSGDRHYSPDGNVVPLALAGLGLALAGVPLPVLPETRATGEVHPVALALMRESGLTPARLVLLARLPFIVLSLVLACLVADIARRLFGGRAGLAALALVTTCPPVLANGRLATGDAAFTLAFTASAWLLARCLERPSAARVLASAGVAAIAFVTKCSCLLLVPVGGCIALVRLAARAPLPWLGGREATTLGRRLTVVALVALVHGVVIVAGIWASHAFRWHPTPDGADVAYKQGGWEEITPRGLTLRAVLEAHERRLLPDAWLFGMAYTLKHAGMRRGYALGEYGLHGWPWYFPLALALKLPLATLALILLGVLTLPLAWRAGRRATLLPLPRDGLARWATRPWGADLLALSPLLAILVVYWAIALRTPLNIGLRHVLPTFPATLVLASAALALDPARRGLSRLVALLVVLAAVEGVSSHPHHLAWMNALGGAPERRWTRLADSALDWGQDTERVAGLIRELAASGDAAPVHVGRFGADELAVHGVAPVELPGFLDTRRSRSPVRLRTGWYSISATTLVQIYSAYPGPWARPYEDEWRAVDAEAGAYLASAPSEQQAQLAERGQAYWGPLLGRHEQLRMARLCSWLRHERPDVVLGGGATLVWHLDAGEIEDALHGAPRELVEEPVLPWGLR